MYGEVLTFRRCSVHRSAFLNWPDMVLTFPGDVNVSAGADVKRGAETTRKACHGLEVNCAPRVKYERGAKRMHRGKDEHGERNRLRALKYGGKRMGSVCEGIVG